jgi:uncharacterized membrane protein
MARVSTKRAKVAVRPHVIAVRQVPLDAPWKWLAAGWDDMLQAPMVSFGYGLMFAIVSGVLTLALFELDLTALVLSLAAGFMILAPMLAIGMYEASRRLEAGQPVTLPAIVATLFSASSSVYFAGALLMIMFLVWVRVATLLFALFYGTHYPPFATFIESLFFTANGLGLLIVGTGVGAVFALATLASTVVSIPMLLDRDVDTITAMITSLRAFQANVKTMLIWGWVIAALMIVGIVTLFIGMIVTFPLLGHATWHAYRDLVGD